MKNNKVRFPAIVGAAAAAAGFGAVQMHAVSIPGVGDVGSDITVNDNRNTDGVIKAAGTYNLKFGVNGSTQEKWGGGPYSQGTATINGAGAVTSFTTAQPDPRGNIANPYSNVAQSLVPGEKAVAWPKVWEDEETEPGCWAGQKWDLEALYYRTKLAPSIFNPGHSASVSVVGGYNFATGAGGFLPGDIFIDLGGDAVNDIAVDSVSNAYSFIAGNKNYDFVIHFTDYAYSGTLVDRGVATPLHSFNDVGALNQSGYQIIDLRSGPAVWMMDVKYTANNRANPFRYVAGGTVLGTGTAAVTAGLTDADTGFSGDTDPGYSAGSHYALNVPDVNALIAALGLDANHLPNPFGGHLTYGCGNDELVGYVAPGTHLVPDAGATLSLLGIGMAGLGLMSRRAKK